MPRALVALSLTAALSYVMSVFFQQAVSYGLPHGHHAERRGLPLQHAERACPVQRSTFIIVTPVTVKISVQVYAICSSSTGIGPRYHPADCR